MTRPPSFHRRVGQVMCDLLAASGTLDSRRAATTAAEGDPLPVRVAARLGILLATATDPTVLTVGLRRGTGHEQMERGELVRRSAAGAVSFDVTAPLALPVKCGRRTHVIELADDDSVLPVVHPGVDIASERVAASLGGQMLPCVREVIAGGQAPVTPNIEHGPRPQPITAGELLAFVRTCRSWMRRGFSLEECASAVNYGLSHGEVQAHLEAGLDLPAAAQWVSFPVAEALRWIAIDFTPADVQTWQSQGRTLKEAERAAWSGGGGRWLARWAKVAGPSVKSPALAGWAAMGLPVGIWGDVASRGVLAEDAQTWLAEGFSSVEILRYAHLRVGLTEALRWRDEGFTGFVAAGCLGVGMTLADACALRGLPTREVQDSWRRHGSVEPVRAEIEAVLAEERRRKISV